MYLSYKLMLHSAGLLGAITELTYYITAEP